MSLLFAYLPQHLFAHQQHQCIPGPCMHARTHTTDNTMLHTTVRTTRLWWVKSLHSPARTHSTTINLLDDGHLLAAPRRDLRSSVPLQPILLRSCVGERASRRDPLRQKKAWGCGQNSIQVSGQGNNAGLRTTTKSLIHTRTHDTRQTHHQQQHSIK